MYPCIITVCFHYCSVGFNLPATCGPSLFLSYWCEQLWSVFLQSFFFFFPTDVCFGHSMPPVQPYLFFPLRLTNHLICRVSYWNLTKMFYPQMTFWIWVRCLYFVFLYFHHVAAQRTCSRGWRAIRLLLLREKGEIDSAGVVDRWGFKLCI